MCFLVVIVKGLIMSDIWKNAPEGATHIGTYGNFFKEIDGKFAFFTCGVQHGGWLIDNQSQPNRLNLTPRPEAKPVYTQAMCDAEIYESNNSGAFIIIDRDGYERVTVQFTKTGYTTVTTNQNVQKGQVKDKLRPSVYGVGFVGVGHYTPRVNGNISKSYQTWISMLERCYSHLQSLNNPTYEGCTVCSDWHNFQIFAEWFNSNYIEGYHLDKDIKIKGNKMYSPFSCMFVSEQENVEEAHAKSYSLISPAGDVVSVYNMSKHCREHGLSTGHMSSVVNGNRQSHKGWTIDTLTDNEKAFDKFLSDEYNSNITEFQGSESDVDFIVGLQSAWKAAINFKTKGE